MIVIDEEGYSIIYSKNNNTFVIGLPQTMETATNTIAPIANRKSDFTDVELGAILLAVKTICKGGEAK